MAALPRMVGAVLSVLCLVACSPRADEVRIVDPWTRATPPGATVGGGYLKIVNGTAKPVRLVGAETAVADKVEVHAMSMEGGVMRMRPLEGGLEVPPGGEVELKPGGMHLMLIGLKRALVEGETAPLTLVFDGGVRIEVGLKVEGFGGRHGN
jgi:periplasmic copper chaperone A